MKRACFRAQIAGIAVERLVFLDECGFALNLHRFYGGAPKGERCFESVPFNKGQNRSVLGAYGWPCAQNPSGLWALEQCLGAWKGEMLLPPEDLLRSLRAISPQTAQSTDLVHPLSARELEVLGLLAIGLPNKEIAPLLFIGESTVKTHVAHIIDKLGVSDRVQAVVWAAWHGMLLSV